jgi:hypothetical protein
MSINEQNHLEYDIIKKFNLNSYSRKNIGYLYAIHHGAKEIYEIEEDIIIPDLSLLNKKYNNRNLCYGINNYSGMINPYYYFGENIIWPRGFRLNDIGKEYNNKFFFIKYNQIILKPLIIQGLINGIPDIDSILFQTKIEKKKLINFNFSKSFPLLYFPGNFIPINSKNTKYSFEVFPFLFIPTTVNRQISDILRGYILQRFAWGYNGVVIYDYSTAYRKDNIFFNSVDFIKEKKLFYELDKFLKTLNSNINDKNDAFELLILLIKNLIKLNFLGEEDLIIYKTFLQDLLKLGYNNSYKFINKINYNYKEFLKINSEFIFQLSQPILYFNKKFDNNNIKIIKHYIENKIYKNILLIIIIYHK